MQSHFVPAAHWWLSRNVKLGLIWGSLMHYGVFVLVCCAFCMLGNVLLTFLEELHLHLVKVEGRGYFFFDVRGVEGPIRHVQNDRPLSRPIFLVPLCPRRPQLRRQSLGNGVCHQLQILCASELRRLICFREPKQLPQPGPE